MSKQWETKLQQLQRSIIAFREFVGIDLYYGVIHVRGPEIPAVYRASLTFYAAGGALVEAMMVPLSSDEYQLHCVFGTDNSDVDPEVLKQFKSLLRGLRDFATLIPKNVLPVLNVPAMAQGPDEDFVRWGLSLLWLGTTEQKVFHSEVEYAATESKFRATGKVTSWDDFSPVPGFDPIALISLKESLNQGWIHWNQEHTKAGRSFPEVFTASLTKPLFYASINAIDLLVQRGREQRPVQNSLKVPPRKLRDDSTMDKTESALLSVLREHHGTRDAACYELLKQPKIAEILNVSQPTVHRALGRLLDRISYGKGLDVSQRYSNLCKLKLIIGVLEQLENPRRRDELTSDELDSLDDDNRRF